MASAEDVILSKLRWYKLGGKVSSTQWSDVLGVLRVQRAQLDYDYLRKWAEFLGLGDLLEQALSDPGEPRT